MPRGLKKLPNLIELKNLEQYVYHATFKLHCFPALRIFIGQTTTAQDTNFQEVIKLLREHKCPAEKDLETLAQLPHENQLFFQLINKDSSIAALCEDPMLTMVELKLEKNETISTLFAQASSDAKVSLKYVLILYNIFTTFVQYFIYFTVLCISQETAHLLHVIFSAVVKKLFYKLNVHDGKCDILMIL